MIALEQLEEMFANMRLKSKWNVESPLLWGYFFTNSEPSRLNQADRHLQALGYSSVGVREDDQGTWWLHVERVEVHTPKSLDSRNRELESLAHQFGLDSYDGMDVGLVEQPAGQQ